MRRELIGMLAVSFGCGQPWGEAEQSRAPVAVDAGLQSSTRAPQVDEQRREDARLVVEIYCGECHRRDMAEYNPDAGHALDVFDLWTPDWAATLSKAQLGQFEERLEAQGALPAEVSIVEAYVGQLLATMDGA